MVEPVYGCWEGNMSHALERRPVDICRLRGEEKVVPGNAGVVRILKAGKAVRSVREGDLCLVFGNAVQDEMGFMKKAFGYDAPRTVGILARRTKMHEKGVIPIPAGTRHSLQQWAAFSVRYITAWANWKAAYGCLSALLSREELPFPIVWGWGGGVALAELQLAKLQGCRTGMIASSEERLKKVAQDGHQPIDRRKFQALQFDEKRYRSDPAFKKSYQEAEERFLEAVREGTEGKGVSIFVDNIGTPVFRATLKALARPGVVTTAGWKAGMHTASLRALECMSWHLHVHTHYARYPEALDAVRFAEKEGWMPEIDGEVYLWDEIPRLAEDYAQGKISSYFPLFHGAGS